MILPALSPGAQFSVFTLVYVKHRALPPLNYFLRALAAPGIRYFIPDNLGVNMAAFKGGFLLAGNLSYYRRMGNLDPKKKIGKIGERIAANYFLARGCEIIEMNFENSLGYRLGEIDVVARDAKKNEIIFVEVKTRRKGTVNSETPELAISRAKYRKLSKIISTYLRKENLLECNYRLDAIAIELDLEKRKADLRHLKYIYY